MYLSRGAIHLSNSALTSCSGLLCRYIVFNAVYVVSSYWLSVLCDPVVV